MTARDPREELIEHLPAMRAFAMGLTRDAVDADDLVQDAVVRAWGNFDKFQTGTNLKAWLFTILRNSFYSDKRKAKRIVADVDGAMTAKLAEKPAHDGRLQMNDFLRAFAKLPDEQREALALVGASGFSYEEAAEMTGVAVGTVKSRANRARRRLTELLELSPDESPELTDLETASVLADGRGRHW